VLEEFLSGYYGAIVIISHDKSFLDNITNRTFELSRGKLIDLDLKFSDFLEARKKTKGRAKLLLQKLNRSKLQKLNVLLNVFVPKLLWLLVCNLKLNRLKNGSDRN
jgi:ATP-binding cassette subfamily F protein 3